MISAEEPINTDRACEAGSAPYSRRSRHPRCRLRLGSVHHGRRLQASVRRRLLRRDAVSALTGKDKVVPRSGALNELFHGVDLEQVTQYDDEEVPCHHDAHNVVIGGPYILPAVVIDEDDNVFGIITILLCNTDVVGSVSTD